MATSAHRDDFVAKVSSFFARRSGVYRISAPLICSSLVISGISQDVQHIRESRNMKNVNTFSLYHRPKSNRSRSSRVPFLASGVNFESPPGSDSATHVQFNFPKSTDALGPPSPLVSLAVAQSRGMTSKGVPSTMATIRPRKGNPRGSTCPLIPSIHGSLSSSLPSTFVVQLTPMLLHNDSVSARQ